MLDEAPKYPEGTGLRFQIKAAKDIAVVKKLAAIKLQHLTPRTRMLASREARSHCSRVERLLEVGRDADCDPRAFVPAASELRLLHLASAARNGISQS